MFENKLDMHTLRLIDLYWIWINEFNSLEEIKKEIARIVLERQEKLIKVTKQVINENKRYRKKI